MSTSGQNTMGEGSRSIRMQASACKMASQPSESKRHLTSAWNLGTGNRPGGRV